MCHEDRDGVFELLQRLGARPVDVASELTELVPGCRAGRGEASVAIAARCSGDRAPAAERRGMRWTIRIAERTVANVTERTRADGAGR